MSEKKSLFNESLDKESRKNSKLFKKISEFSQVKSLHLWQKKIIGSKKLQKIYQKIQR